MANLLPRQLGPAILEQADGLLPTLHQNKAGSTDPRTKSTAATGRTFHRPHRKGGTSLSKTRPLTEAMLGNSRDLHFRTL